MASVDSYPARSAGLGLGRAGDAVGLQQPVCVLHQRPLSRINSTSAGLLRTSIASSSGASGATVPPVASPRDGPS